MHRVVPELIVENYRAGNFHGEFPAVGMFLDLSGFSTMTDALMQHGQHGAEVLAMLMHGVFDPLVESIFNYGGKIVGFAGDGILALFPIETDQQATAMRALASVWLIQQRLAENSQRHTIYGSYQFTVRIGLTLGRVTWGILHSDDRQSATYFFRGSAVDDCVRAEHNASVGEILITDTLSDLVGNSIQTISSGSFQRLIGLNTELLPTTPILFPPIDLDISKIFMPEEVIVQDARGEFRQIVNLFMRFPDITDQKLAEVARVIFNLRKQYGGLLNRVDFGDKGCNILMLWGAPVAYENDIGRALHFVLDLQSRLDIPVTAGITYYVAHAGYLGSSLCEDYTCYGWGVNLASRFMMSAPDGEIWVDDRIARRVSHRFEIERVGSYRFKGFSAEQVVNRLRGHRFHAESVYLGEMIGRERELSQLEKFIDPIWRNEFAGVALVAGDAGVGKGRLVQGFRFSPFFEARPVLWAICQSEQILRQSLNPFRSWLFHYFGFSLTQDLEERIEIFDRKMDELIRSVPLPELARELECLRSVLGALVDLFWPDSLYEQLDAEARYNSTLLALTSLLKAESLRQPLILFVEDLQFIDEDSLQLLPRLRRSISAGDRSYPIAIIMTSRNEDPASALVQDLVDTLIPLRGLPREAVARLVEILLGGIPSLRLVNLVTERSEGNPYFVEQIVRYLQDGNLIEMSADGWRQVEEVRGSILPGDIVALLIARLDKLSRKVKDVVQMASVFGREFLLNVLTGMAAEGRLIEQYVDDAERSAIWTAEPDGLYIFTHGLLRDAAYTMQMRARRRDLHALAVTALETIYGDDRRLHYAELAYHSERGELREKALHYYTLAGKSASDAYQNAKGVEYLTKALSLTLQQDAAAQFELLAERVNLLDRMAKREAQWNDLRNLQSLAKHLGDDTHIAISLLHYTVYFYLTGNYSDCVSHAERAFTFTNVTVESELAYAARICWFLSHLRLGHVDTAMQLAQDSLQLARQADNPRQLGRVLSSVGLVALEQKEPAFAGSYLAEALTISFALNDRNLQNRAFINLAIFEAGVNGNHEQAYNYYSRALELAREIGDRVAESQALANLGFTAGLLGKFSEAKVHHERALMIARESGNIYSEIYILINLSANAEIQGQASLGSRYAQEAIGLSQKIGEVSGEAWGWLYLGHAQLKMNEVSDAQRSFSNSVAIRERLNQPALATEPLAGLAEAALQAGNFEFAASNVEQILSYLDGGGTLDGTDEPLRVYHNCFSWLDKRQDPRAVQVLQAAIQMLDAQTSKIKEERSRAVYIENVPWRLALWQAAKEAALRS